MKLLKGMKASRQKKAATIAPPVAPQATARETTLIVPDKLSASGGARKLVTIEAKIDVGFGNALYLRGQGHGLSWDRGIPLVCLDGKTWQWSGEAPETLKFKLLLNDAIWSKGEDLVATPGERLEVAPSF